MTFKVPEDAKDGDHDVCIELRRTWDQFVVLRVCATLTVSKCPHIKSVVPGIYEFRSEYIDNKAWRMIATYPNGSASITYMVFVEKFFLGPESRTNTRKIRYHTPPKCNPEDAPLHWVQAKAKIAYKCHIKFGEPTAGWFFPNWLARADAKSEGQIQGRTDSGPPLVNEKGLVKIEGIYSQATFHRFVGSGFGEDWRPDTKTFKKWRGEAEIPTTTDVVSTDTVKSMFKRYAELELENTVFAYVLVVDDFRFVFSDAVAIVEDFELIDLGE